MDLGGGVNFGPIDIEQETYYIPNSDLFHGGSCFSSVINFKKIVKVSHRFNGFVHKYHYNLSSTLLGKVTNNWLLGKNMFLESVNN